MENFLVEFLVALNVVVLKSDLLVREQHEVVNQYFSGFFQRIFRVNGTVRRNFNNQFVVVSLLFNTIRLNRIFHVTDRSVNRIDRNNVDVSAELTVLVCGYVTAAFVYGKVYLH